MELIMATRAVTDFSNSSLGFAETHQTRASIQNGSNPILARCCSCVVGVMGFALFIIGCVATRGNMTGVAVGGCAVGLGVPSLILNALKVCGKGNQAQAFIDAIEMQGEGDMPDDAKNALDLFVRIGSVVDSALTLMVVIVGVLAIAGHVTPVTAGWAIVAPTLIGLSMSALCCSCICCAGCAMAGVLAIATASES